MVLAYKEKYHVQDDTTVITPPDAGWANDTPALINFTLTAQKVVLILYSGHGYGGGAANQSFGGRLAINLDAGIVAITNYAPFVSGAAWGAGVVWLGLLAAGAHTVQGQIQRRSLSTQIMDRRLLVVIFDGTADDFRYVRDTTAASTTGPAFVDDPNGSVSFDTPACKALVIYSQSCDGSIQNESTYGKKTRIDIDGTYQSVQMEQLFVTADAENTFEAVIQTLTAALHTFTGQFGSVYAFPGETVRIHERQLAVLLFTDTLETNFVETSVAVTVTGTALGDDTQASVSRNIADTRYVLAIYSASKLRGQSGTSAGKKVAINVDGTDYTLTGQNSASATEANHKAYFADVVTLAAGVRTVDGRFAAFTEQTARVTDRTLCVLWFPLLAPPKPKGSIAMAAKVAGVI